MGGGVWKKFQCYERKQWSLEKNSTAMNENSGVWKNKCDRIY